MELFEHLDFIKQDERVNFNPTNTGKYLFAVGEIKLSLVLIEIKSEVPPTECVLKLHYSKLRDNSLLEKEINLIKYRKSFNYENGIYTLYFDEVRDFGLDGITPLYCKFIDTRNEKSTAKLYYRSNFESRED